VRPGYPQQNAQRRRMQQMQQMQQQMSYPPNFTPGSGAYGAMGPGGQMRGGPSMPPGGYGSMTPQGGMQQPPPQGGMAEIIAKYKEMSMPRRVMVILLPIAMLLAVYTLFFDDPEPP